MLVGVLILAGAQNTSIVGANGVLNRLAEDGVLTSWFQRPHHRFGTSYRLINLIVVLQFATIILIKGNVFVLAGLYAFGVIWSFTLNALAVLVLRYTEPENRQWKVPGNLRIRGKEIPVGVIVIFLVLFTTAVVNLFTKYEATISGVGFSALLFVLFTYSERRTARERHGKPTALVAAGESRDPIWEACEAALDRGVTGAEITGVLVAILPALGNDRIAAAAAIVQGFF